MDRLLELIIGNDALLNWNERPTVKAYLYLSAPNFISCRSIDKTDFMAARELLVTMTGRVSRLISFVVQSA